MSHIDDLIAEHCPNGVGFHELGHIAAYSDTRIAASAVGAETFVGVDNLLSNQAGRTISTYVPTTGNLTEYQQGDILIGNIRPYLKKICLAANAGGCSGDVLAVRITEAHRPKLMPEFLYWILSSDAFFAFDMQHAKGAKMPRGDKAMILKYRVPVPPLEIQREIVKVLDTFIKIEADLKAVLKAEMEARQRQYKYYREALFTFDKQQTSHKALGEVGEFIRGNGLQKSDLTETGVGAIHYGQIHTHYGTWTTETKSFVSEVFATKLRKAQSGDLVIATTSEDDEAVAKAVAWIGKDEVAISGDAYIYRHQLEPKYVAYFFQSEQFQDQKKRHITGTKVRRMSGESLAKVLIPVPLLEEQARIVSILDKFDALVNDLSTGLPAEIKTRRQQYEHYRDRLLTFKEAA